MRFYPYKREFVLYWKKKECYTLKSIWSWTKKDGKYCVLLKEEILLIFNFLQQMHNTIIVQALNISTSFAFYSATEHSYV